jgi:hypothetical protein
MMIGLPGHGMDDRLTTIFTGLGDADYRTIAAKALGVDRAELGGRPALSEIKTPHNDRRTIGIVRVRGEAMVGGSRRAWSTVVKIADLSLDGGREVQWISAENEETVYEQGYFAGDGLPFRPARCFRTMRLPTGEKLLWLEDLSDLAQAPFSLDALETMARHLGEWNGFHANRPTKLKFELPQDGHIRRWAQSLWNARLADLMGLVERDALGPFYKDVPLSVVNRLYDAIPALNEVSRLLPHSLAFGDLPIGNLFFSGSETIAIDWASLTSDPMGTDAGCMIGSAATWGRNFVAVLANEQSLFDSYARGLKEAGWRGDVKDARRGYLGGIGHYIFVIATMPVFSAQPGKYFPVEFMEKRFEMPHDDIAERMVEATRHLPALTDEIENLAK